MIAGQVSTNQAGRGRAGNSSQIAMEAPGYDRKAQPFPIFEENMPFSSLLYQIELHIVRTVDSPYTYEQLRGPPGSSNIIRPLVKSIEQSRNPAIIAALLAARLDFSVQEDDRAIHEARAYTAELIALRYAAHLPEEDLIQYVTYEIPRKPAANPFTLSSTPSTVSVPTESTALLEEHNESVRQARAAAEIDIERQAGAGSDNTPYVADSAIGLSALELAILGDAKKFLLSRAIEQIITSIWEGRIVFWDSISVQSKKKAMIYNPARKGNDWYSRLRVPKYRTVFMMLNYAVLLALYYAVLTERNITQITVLEVLLDIWFAGFVYEEIGQMRESGSIKFYALDYWSFFDLAMIFIFLAFFSVRIFSVVPFREKYAHAAFDILSLEALLLVPRVFSSLAVVPYYGTLLPCLKQMTKDFMEFLVLIVILYVGFLTTFSFLGRDHFTVNQMAWLLIRVFFGAPYDGLDAAGLISPIFGPTLMLIFVILTNVLLITVVISILSQRFGRMMHNANEEYMLLFSSSVLESITTSDRLTYYYPPLNLIGIIIRPLRLFLNHSEYRNLRIFILKITHAPLVAMLWIYEAIRYRLMASRSDRSSSSMLHLRSGSNDKKRLWNSQYGGGSREGSAIARGLLVTNQVVLSGTEPRVLQSAFVSGANGKSNPFDSSAGGAASGDGGRGKGTGSDAAGKNGAGGMVKRRKTRKGTIVAQTIKRNNSGGSGTTKSQRPVQPLSSSPGYAEAEGAEIASASASASAGVSGADDAAQKLSPVTSRGSGLRRARTDSTASTPSAAGGGASARRAMLRSKLAISLLRDLRRRSVTLPADTISEAGTSDVGSVRGGLGGRVRTGEGAKALASRQLGDGDDRYDDNVRLRSLSPRRARSRHSMPHEGQQQQQQQQTTEDDAAGGEAGEHVVEDDEDEEVEYGGYDGDELEYAADLLDDDEANYFDDDLYDNLEDNDDDDDDDDDDFLSLYTDTTAARVRGLEEQVAKMQGMIERMSLLLVKNLEKESESA